VPSIKKQAAVSCKGRCGVPHGGPGEEEVRIPRSINQGAVGDVATAARPVTLAVRGGVPWRQVLERYTKSAGALKRYGRCNSGKLSEESYYGSPN